MGVKVNCPALVWIWEIWPDVRKRSDNVGQKTRRL